MRTSRNPQTGLTWRLCAWDAVCQMPVSTVLDGKDGYCRWHARCLSWPGEARQFAYFAEWLASMQEAYPSSGWWGWEAERLWPVLQGVETIWIAESKAA